MKNRTVASITSAIPTLEGAGVRLMRALGFEKTPTLDPFLLLDDFHSEDPEDYLAGFPWHPHRGIETVTYVHNGRIEHGDSLGNRGAIGNGDVQWMTAGSGIIHSEMPKEVPGMMQGFQLWVNLPASHKMMHPRYRDVLASTIPSVSPALGTGVKVIAGSAFGAHGPVKDLVVDVLYIDVTLGPGVGFELPVAAGHSTFAYVYAGEASFGDSGEAAQARHLVRFRGDGAVSAKAGPRGASFLLGAGRPLREPVAWRGPIVMNTEEELDLAFREFHEGNFIRHGKA